MNKNLKILILVIAIVLVISSVFVTFTGKGIPENIISLCEIKDEVIIIRHCPSGNYNVTRNSIIFVYNSNGFPLVKTNTGGTLSYTGYFKFLSLTGIKSDIAGCTNNEGEDVCRYWK